MVLMFLLLRSIKYLFGGFERNLFSGLKYNYE